MLKTRKDTIFLKKSPIFSIKSKTISLPPAPKKIRLSGEGGLEKSGGILGAYRDKGRRLMRHPRFRGRGLTWKGTFVSISRPQSNWVKIIEAQNIHLLKVLTQRHYRFIEYPQPCFKSVIIISFIQPSREAGGGDWVKRGTEKYF